MDDRRTGPTVYELQQRIDYLEKAILKAEDVAVRAQEDARSARLWAIGIIVSIVGIIAATFIRLVVK